jgi:AcrR family transcriptional regulator
VSRPAPRPRADTRGELLAAARRVIRRQGFAGATVGEITREAGASLGLLNYHFGTKDEVLAEAFDEIARGELAELEEIARRPDPPAERLAAYLDVSDWGDRESWTLWLDAWADAARVDALRRTLAHYALGWRAALAVVLADGVRAGAWACPDPGESASIIVAMIDGVGLQSMLHPAEVTPERAGAWCRRFVEAELGVALPAAAPARTPAIVPAAAPTAFEARMAIRGRDLDAAGTVHPAAHLAYLEEAC